MSEAVDAARIVSDEGGLQAVATAAARASRVAVDLEASGMFAYHAAICTMQLAWDGEAPVVVDALAVPLAVLRALLGPSGPVKIVHDVSFDARLLAEANLVLGHVHDTALAARMLGRTATGLATLLEAELGVHIDKDLQQHDWRLRPLDARTLGYLARDVGHLAALDDKLWAEVSARGIEAEVLEETQYRLDGAVEAMRTPDTTPAYARIKGVDRLAERELAVLRPLAQLREDEARSRDVPPYRVLSNDALVTVARERPRTAAQVARLRGFPKAAPGASRLAEAMARVVADAGDTLPEEERARFERPRPPQAFTKARREREARLLAWRRVEAKARGVDEQVVLPGHCVRDAVEREPATADDLRDVAGIGTFRIARDGEAIVRALRGEAAP